MFKKEEKETEVNLAKYASLELLCRLLLAASAEGLMIGGYHLAGLADLLLTYVDSAKRIEASRGAINVSALSELKAIQEIVQEGALGLHGNLDLIKTTVKGIETFLDDDLKQIIDFKKYFENTGAEIVRALADSETGAKAQNDAGQQPESESTVTQ